MKPDYYLLYPFILRKTPQQKKKENKNKKYISRINNPYYKKELKLVL